MLMFCFFFLSFYRQVNVLTLFFRPRLCLRGGLNISLKQSKNEDIGGMNKKSTRVINYCWARDNSLHIRHVEHLPMYFNY